MREQPQSFVDEAIRLYQTGLSTEAVAKQLGSTSGTVWYTLNKHNVEMRPRWKTGPKKWATRKCEKCAEDFTPTSPNQRRCTKPECKYGTKQCGYCGDSFYPKQLGTAQMFCSPSCRALGRRGTATSKRGQGSGRYFNKDSGYVSVRVTANTPGARVKSDTTFVMLEHRLVAQQNLGRPLRPDETVHHINGDKQDNRWENLQVRSGKHGSGVVLACGDCGSRNVVHVAIA